MGIFADLAGFVDGGKILKTKGQMKSLMTGPIAVALFFNDPQRMTWIFITWHLDGALSLAVGTKVCLRNLERNKTVTVPGASRGKTTMASSRKLSMTLGKCPWTSWPTPASHSAQLHYHQYSRQLLWLCLGMAPFASFPWDWGGTVGFHP